MWADVAKIALLSFLVVGLGVIVVVFVRRVRANGFPERPDDPGVQSWWDAEFGPRPRLSPPEWVHWAEDFDADDPPSRADAKAPEAP